ncbi:MAG: M23 family metallopeptidase [Polyangiaceae bacterium]|nr:M23 family metallopeptidase [Polyangiaceae bacterium]
MGVLVAKGPGGKVNKAVDDLRLSKSGGPPGRAKWLGGSLLAGGVLAAIIGGALTCEGAGKRATLPIVVPGSLDAEPAPPVTAPPPIQDDAGVDPDASIETPVVERKPPWRISSLQKDASVELVQGTLGKLPLLMALRKAGVPGAESNRLVASLRALKNVDRLRPTDRFVVALSRDKLRRVVAYEFSTGPIDVWQAREEGANGSLLATHLELQRSEHPVRAELVVVTDLAHAIREAGLDPSIDNELDTVLEGHVRASEIVPGARLRLVGKAERVEGTFSRYLPLEAVEVRTHGHVFRSYRYASSRIVGAFDASGKQPLHGGWRSPVPLARISSRFNPRRMHPVLHIVMPHNGIDYAAPPGTPVYAAAPGILKFAADSGPCGNMVQILHPNGLVTAYCHLQKFAPRMFVGKAMEEHQLLGYVGQTGRATGPHLHFAVKRGDAFIDPLALKLDRIKIVPSQEMHEFQVQREALDRELNSLGLGTESEPNDGNNAGPDGGADEILDDLVLDGGK